MHTITTALETVQIRD